MGCVGARPGEPLARALGAELRPLRAYNSVGMCDAESVPAIAQETLAAGYAGLKIKVGFPTFAQDLLPCARPGGRWATVSRS